MSLWTRLTPLPCKYASLKSQEMEGTDENNFKAAIKGDHLYLFKDLFLGSLRLFAYLLSIQDLLIQ